MNKYGTKIAKRDRESDISYIDDFIQNKNPLKRISKFHK